jgi:hypothetical protein
MKPSQINDNQDNLFQSRLSNQINPRHEMVILSKLINWDGMEAELSSFHIDNGKGGQPPKPVRLMVGLLLLQHLHSLSDEQGERIGRESLLAVFLCQEKYGLIFCNGNCPLIHHHSPTLETELELMQ